jgi:hypothetical protein
MSVVIRFVGSQTGFSRQYHPLGKQEVWMTATIAGHWGGGRTLAVSGPEADSGGRSRDINLTKMN